jgi:signal transduction histidine kinase
LETAIFRIVQEGLATACRHSGSGKVRIELMEQDERIRVIIEDWGAALTPTA